MVVLLLLMQLPATAQVHQLLLKTPDGEPGYISILCKECQFNIMSNANGWVSLDPGRYQSSDALTFSSIFYQELKIPFGELLKRKGLMGIRLDDVTSACH